MSNMVSGCKLIQIYGECGMCMEFGFFLYDINQLQKGDYKK